MIRPLLPDDVAVAQTVVWSALSELDTRLGQPTPELTPPILARAQARIAHLQQTDPDCCWVLESDGEVVAMTMALVREGMWFLSLLMVHPGHQGRGYGGQLLDRVLTTATDRSWITSTQDPAALRRYRRAGFDLHPAYQAKGALDRSLVPAVDGVREGDHARDADLVNDLYRHVRGAALGPDLPYVASLRMRFLLVDDAAGRAVAFLRPDGVASVAATTPDAARRVLLAGLAECTEDPHVSWLTADQQWAIDACLDLRLPLTGGPSVCLRGQPPMSPYLPNGALG